MAINETGSILYRLPDGDVEVPTWGYIVDQLSYLINPIITSETAVNDALKRIDDKLTEWVEE